jgi:hypothetical protein
MLQTRQALRQRKERELAPPLWKQFDSSPTPPWPQAFASLQ